MMIAPLLGAALVVNAATGPLTGSAAGEASLTINLTIKEKAAATEPLVRSATDCIVHAVTSDPRFAAEPRAAVGDLIVESIRACRTPVRAMIDGYDHYYGEGTGEAFFMGPYLDLLPTVVLAGTNKAAQ
jgi:hypothetical protein